MTSYELKRKSRIEEIAADAVLLEHKKTGAKVFLLSCDDENKVFTIGFRTPPADSCGTPHIIEHSVLCGSEKYPVKDPFIELVKGSMNTFLNAMTYPDRTLYPVASCNEKDFENLMDVYLDAVFHPNMHREENIFLQEGWHYELDDADAPLQINGVVYNEMKGVYSSPDGVLSREVEKRLFQGHPYGEDSGGDPVAIPNLSYEEFRRFHQKYYHPSNAYIYLYGNLDMEKMLEKIDRDYLSKYDRQEIDSRIPDAVPFTEPMDAVAEYSVSETESTENASVLSVHTVVGELQDPVMSTAFAVLSYVLLEMPGAPLREALVAAGIGDDIYGGISAEIAESYFSVVAKNTEPERKEEFLRIVRDVLRQQADGGLDHEALRAAVNLMEFRSREADFGSEPKGLIYGLQAYDSWLYESDPEEQLRYNSIYAKLKEGLETGYFESLIRKKLLDNPYELTLTLLPVKGLTRKKELALEAELAKKKAAMSAEEIQQILEKTARLKEYQSEPSDAEDLRKIPMLSRSDISREAPDYPWIREEKFGYDVIYSNVFTSGIVYLKLIYDLKNVADEDIPYAAFLAEVLGYIDTEKHSYGELSTLTNLHSGGIGFSVESYLDAKDSRNCLFTFSCNAKTLYEKTDMTLNLMREMLFCSKLDDTRRLKDILAEVKARTKDSILSAGHITALNRAGAHYTPDRWFNDAMKGIAYYRVLEEADEELLSRKLRELCGKIFCRENLIVHIVCDRTGYETVQAALQKQQFLYVEEKALRPVERKFCVTPGCAEAFTSASMVNYVAAFGNFRNHGGCYHGALEVLRILMNYDYLWNQVRVLGGAYGCSSIFGVSGNVGFVSYRDPNLTATVDVFRKTVEYLRTYDADEREMTKAVIGCMSDLDAPLTPLSRGLRSLSACLSHMTQEDRQRTREEILGITPEKVREMAELVEMALSDSCLCALANEAQAGNATEMFPVPEALYRK